MLAGGGYLAVAQVTSALSERLGEVGVFWPAAGVALAALLLAPRRAWPAVLLAVTAAEVVTSLTFGFLGPEVLLWAASNVVSLGAAAAIIRRRRAEALAGVRDVLVFALGGVIVGPLLGGLIGAAGTLLAGSEQPFAVIAGHWIVGDAVGVLAIAPLVLLLVRDPAARRRLGHPEPLLILLATAGTVFLVAVTPYGDGVRFLVMVPLLWAALRTGMVGAAAGSAVAGVLTYLLLGLDIADVAALWPSAPGPATPFLQTYLLWLLLTAQLVAAGAYEGASQRAEAQLERRRARGADLLARLAQDAVTAEDDAELVRVARSRLAPVLGDARAEWLIAETDPADGETEVVGRPIGGPASLGAEARAVLDAARRRLAAERELAERETLHRLAATMARLGHWTLEAEDLRLSWDPDTPSMLGLSGVEAEAAQGTEIGVDVDARRLLAGFPEPERARLQATIDRALRDRTGFDLELDMRVGDGETRHLRVLAEPEVRDGRVLRLVGAVQDVTEPRRAALEVEALAERLTTTLESITDAFFTVDADWRLTYVNGRAEDYVQRSRDELLGGRMWDVFPEAVGTELHEGMAAAMADQRTVVVPRYWHPPVERMFEVTIYPSEQGLAVYYRDVTEQDAAERRLRDRETQLASQARLLDEATDAILVRDLDGRITFFSRGAERILGYSAEETEGLDSPTLFAVDRETFDGAMAEVREHGVWHGELVKNARDGTALTMQCRWTLVRDDAGEPEAVLCIETDVSERRQMEEQLLRAQRMESIGTLAGGIAHDLNNVLAPILMTAETLQQGESDPTRRSALETIERSGRRGAELVRKVLSFARGVDGERVPVRLDRVTDDAVRMAADAFPQSIEVDAYLGEVPPVTGDATQLHQVVLNLCINARDAMPDGGRLTVTCAPARFGPEVRWLDPDARPGHYVAVKVADEGEGMSVEVRERIFDPFFTTKGPGEGTGLGLSTARGIVRSHGGFITVVSAPGHGATFAVYVPVASEAATDADAAGGEEAPPSGAGRTVLVVDDEPAAQAATRATLERAGYRVRAAGDGRAAIEAVETIEASGEDLDVVLTDLRMPRLDGVALLRRLRETRPDLPVVVGSGLLDQHQQRELDRLAPEAVLAKPFTGDELLRAVGDACARAARTHDTHGTRR